MVIKILTKNMHVAELQRIHVYESLGGYAGLAKALREYKPDEVIEIVTASMRMKANPGPSRTG
ncbi:MAG: hypothetical protein H6Q07_1958 [Acidobacteria bacterium]|nr:hypothetical protein [Acidobacteriota bacterium]